MCKTGCKTGCRYYVLVLVFCTFACASNHISNYFVLVSHTVVRTNCPFELLVDLKALIDLFYSVYCKIRTSANFIQIRRLGIHFIEIH